MKKLFYFLSVFLFFFPFSLLEAQERAEISFGLGINQTHSKTDHFVNEAGAEVGLYMPFFNKNLLSLGFEANAGYYFSDRKPASMPPVPITGIPDNYTTYESMYKPRQRSAFMNIGPRFTFYSVNKLQVALSLDAGLMYFEKSAYSFVQHVVDSLTNPGHDGFDKQIFDNQDMRQWLFRLSPKLRLAYPLTDRISVWGAGAYHTVAYKTKTNRLAPNLPEGTPYDWESFVNEPLQSVSQRQTMKNISVQAGIAIGLSKKKQKKPHSIDWQGVSNSGFPAPKPFPPYQFPKLVQLENLEKTSIRSDNSDSGGGESRSTTAIGFNSSRNNRPMQLKANDAVKKTMMPALWIDASGMDTYTTINQDGKLYVIGFNSSRSNRPTDIIILPEKDYSVDTVIQRNEIGTGLGFNSSRSNRPLELKKDGGDPKVFEDEEKPEPLFSLGFNSSRSNRPLELKKGDIDPTVVISVSEHRNIHYFQPGDGETKEPMGIEIPGYMLDAIGFNSSRSNRPMQLGNNKPGSVIRIFDIQKFTSTSSCGALTIRGWNTRSNSSEPWLTAHLENFDDAITFQEDHILYIINFSSAGSPNEKTTLIDIGEVNDIENKMKW